MEKVVITADNDFPERADRYVAEYLGINRSRIKAEKIFLTINGKEAKFSKTVTCGDVITAEIPEQRPSLLSAEDMDLDILYEDRSVIVVNKAQGVVVHPAAGNFSGTLVNGILGRVEDFEEEFSDGGARPGIVHRLDKDTSGVIIIAKNPEAHEFLSQQFRERTARKVYIAVAKGRLPKKHDVIRSYIARDRRNRKKFAVSLSEKGKYACTEYDVLKEYEGYSLCELRPLTGRTHQIRVHLQSLNTPVLGDPVYSRRDAFFPDATLMLHSLTLEICIPEGGRKIFTAPMPERFKKVLEILEGKK